MNVSQAVDAVADNDPRDEIRQNQRHLHKSLKFFGVYLREDDRRQNRNDDPRRKEDRVIEQRIQNDRNALRIAEKSAYYYSVNTPWHTSSEISSEPVVYYILHGERPNDRGDRQERHIQHRQHKKQNCGLYMV